MGGGKRTSNPIENSSSPASPLALETASEDSMSEPQSVDELSAERKRKRDNSESDNNEETSLDDESSISEKKSRISAKLAWFTRNSYGS